MSLKQLLTTTALSGAVLASLSGTAMAETVTPVLSDTGTGQALIFPYYTVNGGWMTTINVMNTTGNTLAVKFRLREKKNSRDVLDFNIVLSPYDAWAGVLQDSANGPQLFTPDNSCTSPQNISGVTAQSLAYTGRFSDGGGSEVHRMRDGYIEMFVMGIDKSNRVSNPGTVPYNAKHINGVPRDCAAVDRAFVTTIRNSNGTLAGADTWIDGTSPLAIDATGSGSPVAREHFDALAPTDSPLKGNVTWLQAGTGAGAGSTAIHVNNWSQDNYVTAQQYPWFLEPTLANPQSGGLWQVTGLEDLEAAIMATSTMNEWANNPDSGAQVDWVITFPTKAYHVDRFNDQIQAAVNRYRNTDAAGNPQNITADAPTTVWPFARAFNGISPINVTYTFYDREEQTAVTQTDGQTTISPQPPAAAIPVEALIYEANVIQFGSQSVLASSSPAVPKNDLPPSATPAGWASVTFTDGALPVTAFAIKARTIGNTLTNFGQAMDNAYVR